MKYNFVIYWIETTTIIDEEELKECMESLPNPKVTGMFKDMTEIECWDLIEAYDLEELKKIIKEDYYEVEIFSVFLNDEIVLTEEDL